MIIRRHPSEHSACKCQFQTKLNHGLGGIQVQKAESTFEKCSETHEKRRDQLHPTRGVIILRLGEGVLCIVTPRLSKRFWDPTKPKEKLAPACSFDETNRMKSVSGRTLFFGVCLLFFFFVLFCLCFLAWL